MNTQDQLNNAIAQIDAAQTVGQCDEIYRQVVPEFADENDHKVVISILNSRKLTLKMQKKFRGFWSVIKRYPIVNIILGNELLRSLTLAGLILFLYKTNYHYFNEFIATKCWPVI